MTEDNILSATEPKKQDSLLSGVGTNVAAWGHAHTIISASTNGGQKGNKVNK